MSEKDLKTSQLLFDEAPLLVRPALACRVGLNEAIVLQQVHYWLENKKKSVKEKDLENEYTYREGKFWTYDSYKEWQTQFPFWSEKTIQRIFTSLEKQGVLISDKFNKRKADNTKWYTIDYDALDNYVKPKRKSKHDNKEENVDVEHEVNLTSVNLEHTVNLTKSVVEHEVNLTIPSGQLDQAMRSTCPEEEVNLTKALPENSFLDFPSENSNLEFINSSSSLIDDTSYVDNSKNMTEEEEKRAKRFFTYLGMELAKEGIMRTDKQIKETQKLLIEKGIIIFDAFDVERAIKHYKEKCADGVDVGAPPLYFANGFEIKLNQKYAKLTGIEHKKAQQRAKEISSQHSTKVEFYNWLES